MLLTSHTPSITLTLPRATSVAQSHFLLQLVMMEFVLTSLKYLHLYAHHKLTSAYLLSLQIFLVMDNFRIVYILVSVIFYFLPVFHFLLILIQMQSIISLTSILISLPQMLQNAHSCIIDSALRNPVQLSMGLKGKNNATVSYH